MFEFQSSEQTYIRKKCQAIEAIKHYDKKKIEIGSEDRKNGIRHEIELNDKDEIVEITQILLLDKEDVV